MKTISKEGFDSPNLFEKMSLLTERQITEIFNGVRWTLKNCKSAVVIGGVALAHHLKESRDLTPDIDFLVDDMDELKLKLDRDNILYSSKRMEPVVGI